MPVKTADAYLKNKKLQFVFSPYGVSLSDNWLLSALQPKKILTLKDGVVLFLHQI